jgi:uncharacterized Zn finger protein (UPF0148 family)
MIRRLPLLWRIRLYVFAMRLYRKYNNLCSACGSPLKLLRGTLTCVEVCDRDKLHAEVTDYRAPQFSKVKSTRRARRTVASLRTD